MYSENDLAKATQAVWSKFKDRGQLLPLNFVREVAKAALDAQYLPAQTPPSPDSVRCMIYKRPS